MARAISDYAEELLLRNLGDRGFTLTDFDYNLKHERLSVNEVLIRMVRDYREPRVMEGLVIVIANDPPEYRSLVKQAIKEGLQNQIGYVLEGTLYTLNKRAPGNYSSLETALAELSRNKRQKNRFFDYDWNA